MYAILTEQISFAVFVKVYHRKRMNFNAHVAYNSAAVLKDFFDAYSDARNFRARLFRDVKQTENGFAVGKEIVYSGKFVIGRDIFFLATRTMEKLCCRA